MAGEARSLLPHGYPRLEAYAALSGDALHGSMRAFADEFLARNRDALREYAGNWVADPLHHWSRRWEYPYVFEWLAARAGEAGGAGLRVLDAGSGLTFFPHFVARQLGVEAVQCCDRDVAMERDARRLQPPASPRVAYATRDLTDLGFPDASFDCTYCISVLEHTRERARIVDEFARTLRPGGLLLVTIDVSLDGRAEIPRDEAARLIELLGRRFEPLAAWGDVQRPPSGVLTTGNVGTVAPDLAPPRTYASVRGVLRRLARPHTFPWGRAARRLLGGRAAGGAASEVSFFCTAWLRPTAAGSAP